MIKLFKASTLEDGTIRLQSQLYIGKDSADFILKNNQLCSWRYGSNGLGFYPCDEEYEIVEDIKDMKKQKL